MSFNTGIYPSNKVLGEIKELIKDENLTQEMVADEIGYSRKALNRILNGKNKKIDYDLVVTLCERFGIRAIIIGH